MRYLYKHAEESAWRGEIEAHNEAVARAILREEARLGNAELHEVQEDRMDFVLEWLQERDEVFGRFLDNGEQEEDWVEFVRVRDRYHGTELMEWPEYQYVKLQRLGTLLQRLTGVEA